MYILQVKDLEYYDENEGMFKTRKGRKLYLEHSLISISKWESKWKVPFISDKDKTKKQSIDYIRCMCTNPPDDPTIFSTLSVEEIEAVDKYINDSMTATTISRRGPKKPSREIITSEVIYYWMIQYGIPFDPCEKWHFGRLMTLIEVAAAKSGPQKKMSMKDQMAQQRMLNASRRAKLNSKG